MSLEFFKFDFACDFIQLNDHTNTRNTQSRQHTIELAITWVSHESIQCTVAKFLSFWGVKCVCELCVFEHYAARPSSLLTSSRRVYYIFSGLFSVKIRKRFLAIKNLSVNETMSGQ